MTGLLPASKALGYMLAGNATFTLVSSKSGARYTYRVQAPKEVKPGQEDTRFVKLLTGADNESAYTYMGMIAGQVFRLTRASKLSDTSTPVKAFAYVLDKLTSTGECPGVEVWHEGKCGRCGRKLTVPESIAAGIGPECSKAA